MKIVHLIFSFKLGGAELMLIDIINEQVKTNDVSLIVLNDYSCEVLRNISPSVDIHLINRKEGSKNPYYLFKLNRLIRKISPSIIHCHNANMIDLIWGKSVRKLVMLTVHTTGINFKRFGSYQAIFAISKAVQLDIQQRYAINPILVYNGVNIENIKDKKPCLNKRESFSIVQISRLEHKNKGQHILIKALRLLLDKGFINQNISIDFIGTGSSEDYLKCLVNELNLENYINFRGIQPREVVLGNINNYDLLVQPSYNEGFGLTVVEAMLSKVPVLVSNIEGPMEIIQDGKYGNYFQKGNENDLAKELELIITQGVQQNMIAEAFEYAKKNFDIINTTKQYIKYYKSGENRE